MFNKASDNKKLNIGMKASTYTPRQEEGWNHDGWKLQQIYNTHANCWESDGDTVWSMGLSMSVSWLTSNKSPPKCCQTVNTNTQHKWLTSTIQIQEIERLNGRWYLTK